jgi:hypothetical protein
MTDTTQTHSAITRAGLTEAITDAYRYGIGNAIQLLQAHNDTSNHDCLTHMIAVLQEHSATVEIKVTW